MHKTCKFHEHRTSLQNCGFLKFSGSEILIYGPNYVKFGMVYGIISFLRRTKFGDNWSNVSSLRGEQLQNHPWVILIPAFLPVRKLKPNLAPLNTTQPENGCSRQCEYYWNRVSNRSAGMISSRFPGDIFTKIQQNLQFYRHLPDRVTNPWDHTNPVYSSNSSVT